MEKNCGCLLCKNNNEFYMPEEIIEAAKKRNLVIFCGAGISTENRNVLIQTLFDDVCKELEPKTYTSFSQAMSDYCLLPNGRRKLIQKVQDRFNYISSYPELEYTANRFHRELSEIPNIDTIITTNWDTYFEDYCAATPFVYSEDIALWSSCKNRKVLKIHGSIDNIGSIVATKEDYANCYTRLKSGVLSSKLIDLVSTKTIVFIGFSFGDEDFTQILNFIKFELKNFAPHFYIVTIDEDIGSKLTDISFTPIVTDGTYFLHKLKNRLILEEYMTDSNRFKHIFPIYELLSSIHSEVLEMDIQQHPEILYTIMYQDGMQHAFQRYMNSNSGEYLVRGYLENCIQSYRVLEKDLIKEKQDIDSAYCHGYLNGLKSFLVEGDYIKKVPLFYLPKKDLFILTKEEFYEVLTHNIVPNKYLKIASEVVNKDYDDSLVFHHRPEL